MVAWNREVCWDEEPNIPQETNRRVTPTWMVSFILHGLLLVALAVITLLLEK